MDKNSYLHILKNKVQYRYKLIKQKNMNLIATLRQRAYIASLTKKLRLDNEYINKLWERIPKTTEKYKFGDNRELILRDRLYGLSSADARMIITAFTEDVPEELHEKAVNTVIDKYEDSLKDYWKERQINAIAK